MKTSAFHAVCPVEIGDFAAVTVKPDKRKGMKTAYLLPEGMAVEIKAAVELKRITDIAGINYVRSGAVVFLYELDYSGSYERLTIKVPSKTFQGWENA